MNPAAPRRRRRAALTGLTALALLVPAGVAVARSLPGAAVPAAAAASTGLTATFAATATWDGGYSGGYTVRNGGTEVRHGWSLQFDLPAGAGITSVWEGTASARTGHVTLAPASWNADLAPGGSVTVGFVVTHPAGGTGLPAGCLLDGAACTGSGSVTTPPGDSPIGTIAPVTRTTRPPTSSTAAPSSPSSTTASTTASTTTAAPTTGSPTKPTSSAPTSSKPTSSTVPPEPSGTGPGSTLAACQHFSTEVPPSRTVGPSRDATTSAPKLDLSSHLPAPASLTGSLSGGRVTLSVPRVPGAAAYRVWRNGQPVAWVDDWGQGALTVTDPNPCRGAYYTVAALRTDASAASTGRLSTPYRLGDDGTLRAAPLAPGTALTLTVTAYGDEGQTASGLAAGSGICAVDARRIPWGTRLKVDGYGYCYAADIGTWIQGDIVDVWLPNADAMTWGVQRRTVTVTGD